MISFLSKINNRYSLYSFGKNPFLWIYSAYLTLRYVDEYYVFPAFNLNRFIRINIRKGKGAKIIIKNKIFYERWIKGSGNIDFNLGNGSKMIIGGDFLLGDNIKILLSNDASLVLNGKEKESASGITANSIILVHKYLEIGKDCLIAWDTFLTDCDWHRIDGNDPVKSTIIGNHVWIGVGAKILKGCIIGDNSIVTSNSVVLQGEYGERSLISGNPGKVLKTDISDWHRDM